MPQLEAVTKTKIRGVLAILKHGEIFESHPDLSEPVRLRLAPHITTFESLRLHHDLYLKRYAIYSFVYLALANVF